MYALIDGIVKLAYRITDAEYDYLCEVLTDEEMGYFVDDTLPFGKKERSYKSWSGTWRISMHNSPPPFQKTSQKNSKAAIGMTFKFADGRTCKPFIEYMLSSQFATKCVAN